MGDCEKSCAQKKKRKLIHAWWKIDAVLQDGSLVEIDHIDLEPQPYVTGSGYGYFKKGKPYTLTNFAQAELIIVGLCEDPNCKDPECIKAQKRLAEVKKTQQSS